MRNGGMCDGGMRTRKSHGWSFSYQIRCESQSTRKDALVRLKDRGLQGDEFVVSGGPTGLMKTIIIEVVAETAWQRCSVRFLRNALDESPARPMTTACRSCAGSPIGGAVGSGVGSFLGQNWGWGGVCLLGGSFG